jgi:hypothetical protein
MRAFKSWHGVAWCRDFEYYFANYEAVADGERRTGENQKSSKFSPKNAVWQGVAELAFKRVVIGAPINTDGLVDATMVFGVDNYITGHSQGVISTRLGVGV